MYADTISQSMEYAINETKRRRQIQEKYNLDNNIIPKTVIKKVYDNITISDEVKEEKELDLKKLSSKKMTKFEREELIQKLETQMKKAAKALDFEEAMQLRDLIFELRLGHNE
jgi:excinuclease ABC subunit B